MNPGANARQRPLLSSVEELNAQREWFADSGRPPSDNEPPYVIVVDHFYDDPGFIRELALRQSYYQYSPPLAESVGEQRAREWHKENPLRKGTWSASALLTYLGKPVNKPHFGFRYDAEWLLVKLEGIVNQQIDRETWHELGDWWNGAFSLIDRGWTSDDGSIHHHYKELDVYPQGWSGVVYLSPNPDQSAGTSIWRHKKTGKCIAAYGPTFSANRDDYQLAFLAENRWNRLVLFRENVLHSAEHGFGEGRDARLTQTWFFRTLKPGGVGE